MPSFTSSLLALSLAASAVAHQTIWSRKSLSFAAAAPVSALTAKQHSGSMYGVGWTALGANEDFEFDGKPSPEDSFNAEAHLFFSRQTETHSLLSDLTGSRTTGGSVDLVLVPSLLLRAKCPSSSPEDPSLSRSLAMSLGRRSALALLFPVLS